MKDMDFEKRLREYGFRVTPQRRVIIEAIWNNGEHATIDTILLDVRKNISSISPATVYRTLDLFVEKRLAIASKIGNQTVYEIVSEYPHYHLICRMCGSDQKGESSQLRQTIKNINHEFDFLVEPEHLILTGLCAHCRE